MNMKSDNVLPFKRPLNQEQPTETAIRDLKEVLNVYERLIALLRETYDEGLDYFTDGLVEAVVQCRQALASGMDEKTGQEMLKQMKEELRQIPTTLRSMLPGIGPRLGESMEHKLGIRFSSF